MDIEVIALESQVRDPNSPQQMAKIPSREAMAESPRPEQFCENFGRADQLCCILREWTNPEIMPAMASSSCRTQKRPHYPHSIPNNKL
jgi:hypothetical protein